MADETRPKQTDEIDLIELFSRMGRSIKNAIVYLFKNFWNIIFVIIKFLYKNSIHIGIATFAGVVIGFIFYSGSYRYYASSMVATSNTLDNADMISYIDNLDKLCMARDSISLSQKLNIEVSETKKIKSIKALWAYDLDQDGIPDYIDYTRNFRAKDTTVRRINNRFYIRAEVYDETVFNKMKAGIINYIEQNPIVIDLNKNRLIQTQQMIAKIDEEIKKLDSLQKYEYFQQDRIVPRVGANQTLVFTEKERKLYHDDIFELFSRRQGLERNLNVYPEPITVIEDFTPLSMIVNTMSGYIINYGILGFVLGLIIRFIWLFGLKIHRELVKE